MKNNTTNNLALAVLQSEFHSHHIDKNPSNNLKGNLIYIPALIHAIIHTEKVDIGLEINQIGCIQQNVWKLQDILPQVSSILSKYGITAMVTMPKKAYLPITQVNLSIDPKISFVETLVLNTIHRIIASGVGYLEVNGEIFYNVEHGDIQKLLFNVQEISSIQKIYRVIKSLKEKELVEGSELSRVLGKSYYKIIK